MKQTSSARRVCSVLSVLALHALPACSGSLPGPELESARATSSEGRCAPLQTEDVSSPPPSAEPSCDAVESSFSLTQPLGWSFLESGPAFARKVAHLSFDDGPSDWTTEFLDVLREREVRATFFINSEGQKGPTGLTGHYLDQNDDSHPYSSVLKRTVDEGHALGNHTVHHPDLGTLHDMQIDSELDQNELAVNAALVEAGATPQVLSLVRPPHGAPWSTLHGDVGTDRVMAVAQRIARHGLNLLWNVDSTDSYDWAQDESSSRTAPQEPSDDAPTFEEKTKRIVDAVVSSPLVEAGEGINVLMHDTHPTSLAALPDIIEGLRAAGYSFETLEEYAQRRWQRPSVQLSPGPALYARCVAERDWGCEKSSRTDDDGRALEVCGRMWSAYRALGGKRRLGEPIAAQTLDGDSGIHSQAFERGRVELHPENPPPCNIVVKSP